MRDSTLRRFTLLDGMILVAATAMGFALIKPALGDLASGARSINAEFDTPFWRAIRWAAIGVIGGLPLLELWTVAFVVLRLRRPRPRLRLLLRQPGMVAAIAVVVGMLMALIELGAYVYRTWQGQFESYSEGILIGSISISYAVAAAWAIQLLGGRWRAERHWLDRMGRALGVCWLLSFPFVFLGILL